jgi:hypothetical protein
VFDEMRQGLRQIEFLGDPALENYASESSEINHGWLIAGDRRAVLAAISSYTPACPRSPIRRRRDACSKAAGAKRRSVYRQNAAAIRRRGLERGKFCSMSLFLPLLERAVPMGPPGGKLQLAELIDDALDLATL